ncbi:NAD(P)-binding protein [Psychrobacter sp. NZS113]|uniref:NAD(P)/FAD-dependent oxidoreductase n=1 Tax=Psychrobacter sp. NZS113 TaxID=2792045 RepID=UPI0018CF948E|nr:NAD(P)-binding protein [Psychrobacter sp. NZS113]MBH0095091.1 NAD(P)-binding protein [Psychrobacter sp. NZS113]
MTHHPLNRTDTTSPKIAIIGGGLTGLFTATLLERAFSQDNDKTLVPNITIFEKSRSVGRLATRYRTDSQTGKNWQWAFGAQFFTAKTASFQQFIAPWLETDLLQPWCAQVVNLMPANNSIESSDIHSKEQWNTTQARYISTPKMTSWGRELANELQHTTIKFKTRVAPLAQYDGSITEKVDKKTELFDDTGASLGYFDWVICTAPNGQAAELMADSNFAAQSRITEPQMQACYTLMLGWSDIAALPKALSKDVQPEWDVAYLSNSILDRIFIEHQKPAHDDLLPSVTIHASNHWSEQHVDDDIETVQAQLLQAAQQALNWNEANAPSQIDSHRWRYAATVINDSADKEAPSILVDEPHQWIISGDWCAQGNIESCYQMAQQTVEAIYNLRKVL